MLRRYRVDQSEKMIEYMSQRLGRPLHDDLAAFYRERIASIGEFDAIVPVWNAWTGWDTVELDLSGLLDRGTVPIFWDGCGSIFGRDLSPGAETPPVYFFDHDHEFSKPEWAAGSSLGACMLLLADEDRSSDEGWPVGWQLKIDPDIDRCPRARAIWNAG